MREIKPSATVSVNCGTCTTAQISWFSGLSLSTLGVVGRKVGTGRKVPISFSI